MAAGVDVRGFRGHILLPGSLHRSGGRYQWEEGFAPDQVPLAAVPEACLRLALNANKKTRDADERPTATRRTSPRTAGRPSDHTRCLVIGDGENRGGFHGPINGLRVKFFGRFGADADTTGMIAALRQAIRDAPADNHEPHEIERYLSDEYLNEACDSARAYIKNKD